jgi:5-methylthioribose kinase
MQENQQQPRGLSLLPLFIKPATGTKTTDSDFPFFCPVFYDMGVISSLHVLFPDPYTESGTKAHGQAEKLRQCRGLSYEAREAAVEYLRDED